MKRVDCSDGTIRPPQILGHRVEIGLSELPIPTSLRSGIAVLEEGLSLEIIKIC